MGRIRVAYADAESEEWPIDESVGTQRRRAARARLQNSHFCFRGLRARPFWNPDECDTAVASLCRGLEADFAAIASEARALLAPALGDDDDDRDDDADAATTAV